MRKSGALFTWLALVLGMSAGMADSTLPPPKHGGVYVVAHRGAHEGIPENTLAAYRKAIELGADFVEIDVRTTKDGKFVSVHNGSVDAYTKDKKGAVRDLTLEELKALDIGSRIGPEWKEERIPTFEEILEVCKDKIGIYLDLKDAPVAELVPIIKAHGMEKNILWYADPSELKE
ncbi:MAG: glycerophosphodiester phosphodiesterase family protein, partial [Candidatus Hydrogenedentes bacterium]|nr:glycerophosphodiester phosphodiesterase family protein [Candidatus Hydrogenedentota bacterium]